MRFLNRLGRTLIRVAKPDGDLPREISPSPVQRVYDVGDQSALEQSIVATTGTILTTSGASATAFASVALRTFLTNQLERIRTTMQLDTIDQVDAWLVSCGCEVTANEANFDSAAIGVSLFSGFQVPFFVGNLDLTSLINGGNRIVVADETRQLGMAPSLPYLMPRGFPTGGADTLLVGRIQSNAGGATTAIVNWAFVITPRGARA